MCIRRHGYEHNIRVYIYIPIHSYMHSYIYIYVKYKRRKFRSQTSDNMDRGGESQRREEERRSEKRKSQRKEDAGARKGRKVATHCVFPMVCGSGGSKSRLAKAARPEPSGQMRDEKLHAVVARSTFRSQNVKNTTFSDHFLTFRCRFAWQAQGIVHLVKSQK